MEQTYTLTRTFDAEGTRPHTFTVTDTDAINCAHMLAAGFNTISRNFMHTYVLAVVDTEDGRVFYDGKVETINRAEPKPKATDEWPMNNYFTKTFTFEPSEGDADTILTLFGNGETPMFTAAGKMTVDKKSKYEFISRPVLEAAYAELERVKEVLFDAGVETIPADRGVQDMSRIIGARDNEIAKLVQQRANQNAAARDELIEFTRGAYEKLCKVDPEGHRDDLQNRYRGMLDVLANLLVAIGEADRDERHAVARRLVEKSDDVDA